ncbi:MAG: hypothetical protein NVS9B1_02990 [Candidatus Dormibacteraceae bacterium]
MDPVLLAAIIGCVCAIAIFRFFGELDRAQAAVAELPPVEEAPANPLKKRATAHRLDRIGRRFFSGRVSLEARNSIQLRLSLAGNPGQLTPAGFESIRYATAAGLVTVFLLAGLLLQLPFVGLGASVLAAIAGYWAPVVILNQRAGSRRREIERWLPDAVDLLTLAVEAGLSLDAGMADITARFNNALGDEFSKVLREVRLGRPRMEALEEMGRRSGVAELHNLVQAITQSEQMGIGISRSLRVQAAELRRIRRAGAQERAAQASLRMIFPMVGCIFPTIWIILLGPAILGIVKAWH